MSGTEAGELERRASPALSRWRFLFAVAACLAGIAILASLGSWQIERLRWKGEVIATIGARIGAAPLAVEDVRRLAAETGDVEYVPATATGRFLHAGERTFLSTFEGQAGWNVYAPLVLSGSEAVLFVNRGFVPYDRKDPATRREGQVSGEVTVTGLARNAPAEKPGALLPDNDPAANVFFWKNLADMASGLALPAGATLLPFFLDAGAGAAPGGYPVGGVTIIDIPNNHLQYAVTWFGLAAVLAVMLTIFLVRSWRRPGA